MEVSAGALWKFFDAQGLDSVEKLVICVDVDQLSDEQSLGLNSMNLIIEDPLGNNMNDQFTFGENSLLFPSGVTTAHSAECRLEVALGYDFMERFSGSSEEKLKLNVAVAQDSSGRSPLFFIEGKRSWFTLPNLMILVGFAAFWAVFFFMLKKFTLPSSKTAIGAITQEPAPTLSLPQIKVAATDSAA